MSTNEHKPTGLEDIKINIKLKLAGLWTSLMFCYIYGDYFGLFVPGKITEMQAGIMGPLGKTTQGILVGTSILLAIPGLMIFLSLALKPFVNRWANIVLGLFFTVIMLLTMQGAWMFYQLLAVIEISLTLLIVWHAWKWPKVHSTPSY